VVRKQLSHHYRICGELRKHPTGNSAVRSGPVMLLLTISQSVSPPWAGVPNCHSWPYFSLEENFGIVFRGASTLTGGKGSHVQGSQSLSVLCVCSYSCVDVDPVLILLLLLLLFTKVIFTCQVCQSGHCAADYANGIYLRQFRPERWYAWPPLSLRHLYFLRWASFLPVSDIYIIVSFYDFCLLPKQRDPF
jgi:hypothetical protein